jgi:serine/threonine-protein kinase
MGAVLYHLLTGQRTFDSDSISEIIQHVIGRAPVPPRKLRRSIPAGLEAICLRCLEKNPQARYASASALAEDLERFLSGEPIEAGAVNPLRRFRRWLLREPALAGRLVAMAGLLTVEMLWYHVFSISGPRFHRAVTTVLPVWAVGAFLFQKLERVQRRKYAARLCWAVADSAFLTTILYFSVMSVCSPAVICYPLLIAGSGLWHRVSLVWISTALAMASYGLLWYEACLTRPEVAGPYDRHVVFLAGLAILGFIVNRLVHHVQILVGRLSR